MTCAKLADILLREVNDLLCGMADVLLRDVSDLCAFRSVNYYKCANLSRDGGKARISSSCSKEKSNFKRNKIAMQIKCTNTQGTAPYPGIFRSRPITSSRSLKPLDGAGCRTTRVEEVATV